MERIRTDEPTVKAPVALGTDTYRLIHGWLSQQSFRPSAYRKRRVISIGRLRCGL